VHPASPSAPFLIAGFGELVADPSRVAMLLSLLDGLARPASELAQIARVAPSTTSAHLHRLTTGGLVRVEQRGRHRYYRLADDRVADALEALALHVGRPVSPLRPNATRDALACARTCYRHLAGQLGVAWFDALVHHGSLRERRGAAQLTEAGLERLGGLGLDLPDAVAEVAGKPCLDWTERRNHLGGPLGALLTERLLARRWIARRKDTRSVRITTVGRSAFAAVGIGPEVLEHAG
jgi:DNA-binding transcriptional ArsR family regulator